MVLRLGYLYFRICIPVNCAGAKEAYCIVATLISPNSCSLLSYHPCALYSLALFSEIFFSGLDQAALETEARITPLIHEKKRLFNDLLTLKGTGNVLVFSSLKISFIYGIF